MGLFIFGLGMVAFNVLSARSWASLHTDRGDRIARLNRRSVPVGLLIAAIGVVSLFL